MEREFKDPLWQALIASWPTLTQDERRAVSGVARGLAELHGRDRAQALTVIDGGAAMPPASGSARPTAWALAWPQAQAGDAGAGQAARAL